MLFHDEMVLVQQRSAGRFNYVPIITRGAPASWTGRTQRIDRQLLADVKARYPFEFSPAAGVPALRLRRADPNTRYYLCGPPPLVQEVSAALAGLAVPQNAIHYERWW